MVFLRGAGAREGGESEGDKSQGYATRLSSKIGSEKGWKEILKTWRDDGGQGKWNKVREKVRRKAEKKKAKKKKKKVGGKKGGKSTPSPPSMSFSSVR